MKISRSISLVERMCCGGDCNRALAVRLQSARDVLLEHHVPVGPAKSECAGAGATHAWDRLMVPIVVTDPFADQGSYFSTSVVPTVQFSPDVDQAFQSRARVVRFFERNL